MAVNHCVSWTIGTFSKFAVSNSIECPDHGNGFRAESLGL
jgi:hypothetical protein